MATPQQLRGDFGETGLVEDAMAVIQESGIQQNALTCQVEE
jgi:hypothetical protein